MKFFRCLVTSACVLFFSIEAVPVLAKGDATQCVLAIEKIQLKSIGGEWITISKEPFELDLVSEKPVISFKNDGRIPPGKYVNFKITLSESIRVSGADGPNMTKEGGELLIGSPASSLSQMPPEIQTFKVSSPTWNKDAEGLMKQTMNFDFQDRDDIMEIYAKQDFSDPLVIKETSDFRISLLMDMRGTIHYAWPNFFSGGVQTEDSMYWIPPKVVSEVQVKSDSKSVYLSGDSVEWAF